MSPHTMPFPPACSPACSMLAAAMQLSHQAGLLGGPRPPPSRAPSPDGGANGGREAALRAALVGLYRETLRDVLVACRWGAGRREGRQAGGAPRPALGSATSCQPGCRSNLPS
jgi:hypothetical protein